MRGPMHVNPAHSDTPDASTALAGAALHALSIYLAVTALLVFRWSIVSQSWMPLTLHLLTLVLVFVCALAPFVPQAIRDWTPLALGPFLYIELRWIIAGGGRPHSDALIASWDARLFGFDPSRVLATMWHSRALSEFLHLCYLSYYAIVFVPPALLWLGQRRRAFVSTSFALIVMYGLCFITWIVFPVDGPRFLRGPSGAPDGPIRSLVVHILDAGSSRGTAFPSAHVAAAVVAAYCALRYQRPMGCVISLVAVGLAVGAVYGGYHYGVDVVAGTLTGGLAIYFSNAVETRVTQQASSRTGKSMSSA